MKCIHCKYNKETREYNSLIDISINTDDTLKITCKQCGMKFSILDYIYICEMMDPWKKGLVVTYSLPSIKDITKNLESTGLLGPEIDEDN